MGPDAGQQPPDEDGGFSPFGPRRMTGPLTVFAVPSGNEWLWEVCDGPVIRTRSRDNDLTVNRPPENATEFIDESGPTE